MRDLRLYKQTSNIKFIYNFKLFINDYYYFLFIFGCIMISDLNISQINKRIMKKFVHVMHLKQKGS